MASNYVKFIRFCYSVDRMSVLNIIKLPEEIFLDRSTEMTDHMD